MRTGRCECGAVQFRSAGPWRDIIACHCQTCRRTSGHFWAATAVLATALEITNSNGMKWFRSSDLAKRAFCNQCGASLFYQQDSKDYVAIGAGCLDDATGLKLIEEVFAREKGSYYDLTADITHHDTWSLAWTTQDGSPDV